MQALDRAAILLHGEQSHAMRSKVVEAHLCLRGAYQVSERTAARYDDGTAGASRNCGDPILQMGRKREASAHLYDHGPRPRLHTHLGRGPRISDPCRRIKLMHFRDL